MPPTPTPQSGGGTGKSALGSARYDLDDTGASAAAAAAAATAASSVPAFAHHTSSSGSAPVVPPHRHTVSGGLPSAAAIAVGTVGDAVNGEAEGWAGSPAAGLAEGPPAAGAVARAGPIAAAVGGTGAAAPSPSAAQGGQAGGNGLVPRSQLQVRCGWKALLHDATHARRHAVTRPCDLAPCVRTRRARHSCAGVRRGSWGHSLGQFQGMNAWVYVLGNGSAERPETPRVPTRRGRRSCPACLGTPCGATGSRSRSRSPSSSNSSRSRNSSTYPSGSRRGTHKPDPLSCFRLLPLERAARRTRGRWVVVAVAGTAVGQQWHETHVCIQEPKRCAKCNVVLGRAAQLTWGGWVCFLAWCCSWGLV